MDKYTVYLEDMQFVGFHGCREEEKLHGNVFSVDFEGCYRAPLCAATDNLEDTVNYGRIYGVIATVMQSERCNLLETLASRAVDGIAEAFPDQFERFSVCIGKKNPPVGGSCGWSRIKAEWKRK